MPDLNARSDWTIKVDDHDFDLILKALGGRLGNEYTDVAEALGDRLSELKAAFLIRKGQAGQVLANAIAEKQAANPPRTQEKINPRQDPTLRGRNASVEQS